MSLRPTIVATLGSAVCVVLIGSVDNVEAQDPAPAAPVKVVDKLSPKEVRKILQLEGYLATDSDDEFIVPFKIEGTNVQIFVAEDMESIQFHAAWTGTNANLRKVNDWNKSKKYSRAYIDDDGDPHLELDLDLAGGVTLDRVKDFILTSKISLEHFIDEVL